MTAIRDDGDLPLNPAFNAARLSDRAVDELIGICRGVAADGLVTLDEAQLLLRWLERNRSVAFRWPGDVLAERLHAALVDGTLETAESDSLLSVFRELIGGTESVEDRVATYVATLPLTRPPPEVVFAQRAFCITGKFVLGSRQWCRDAVESRGGEVHSTPTRKTQYLVIGSVGSTDWIHSSYGRKIESAVELQRKGCPVAIISEEHWAEALERATERAV